MIKPKLKISTSFVSPIKQFLITYRSAVTIAWEVDKKIFLSITFMNALNGLLLLPSLLITKRLVDAVLEAITTKDVAGGLKMVAFFMALEFLIGLTKSGFERFDWVFSQNLSRFVMVHIQANALGKINSLPVVKAENPEVRNLFKKVFDLSGQRAWGLLMPVSYLPFAVFSIISSSIPIITYSPLIVLPALILALPEIFVGAKYSKKEHDLSTKLAPTWRVWNAYEEFVGKGKYIYENKILGHTSELVTRIRQLAKMNFGQMFKLRLKYGKQRFIISLPLGLVNAGVRIFLYGQAIIGKITLGTAQMQFSAITSLVGNLSGLGRQINEIYENYLYVSDYNEFINISDENIEQGEKIDAPFVEGIEFRNVWFKYPSSTSWILRDVSFTINPHENIAIVGKNGAGKTTLIKLLCKYYSPQKGEILVNGKNIDRYASKYFRKTLSVLFQDFSQYPFSAKENIGFGNITKIKDLERIKKAAQMAGIDEFIRSLPKGYDNPLDIEFEGGIEPSKGQWQRIALARTLFRKSEIFILDEPTSNVDPQAEEEIFEKIITLAKNKIVFLISHRFSTVRKADKILVMDKGKVIESGSHEELVKRKGMYEELFNLQAKAYS